MTYRSLLSLTVSCVISLAGAAQDNAVAAASSDSVAENNIVARINAPASAVAVEMPNAMLERLFSTSTTADDSRDSEAETEEVEADKPARTKGTKSVGYRVQVYADNNARTAKATARQRERVISGAFPQYGTYVTYASPYWRLRVGDFRSQYDAEKAAAEIKRAFPSFAREVRVIRDRINQR